jgi:endoglucanase
MCCLLAIATLAVPARAQRAVPGTAFARGINIAEYLAYPDGEEWPLFRGRRAEVTDAEFKRLARTDLTFIRLPVEPGPFLDLPPVQVAQLERRYTDFLTRAGAAGLAVMVAGFPRHEKPPWRPEDILAENGTPVFARYTGFLTRLATLLQAVPGTTTARELMNEPQPECTLETGTDWTVRQRELHARLRAAAPDLTLVITGGCWSGIDGLETLDMAGYDANTLVDIHYYEPFAFTHQGATWTLPELKYLGGLSFPANRTDRTRAR